MKMLAGLHWLMILNRLLHRLTHRPKRHRITQRLKWWYAVFPFGARPASQQVSGTRLGGEGTTYPCRVDLAPETEGAWRRQRNADHVPKLRAVPVPSDAGTGRVFDQQRMFECQRLNTREF